jgi:hypothetical protein
MAGLAVLLPEIAWNLDFFWRLVRKTPALGLSNYMFDEQIPLGIRIVSLFHVWLPLLIAWLLFRLGYDWRALFWQTMTALVVVPVSFYLGNSKMNVNWVYGFGDDPQQMLPQWVFMLVMTAAFPVFIYLLTHLLLSRWLKSSHS